jgi:serine/threonine protein kinase
MKDDQLIAAAFTLGYVTRDQVRGMVVEQLRQAEQGIVVSTWKLAQTLGLISPSTAREILHHVHATDVRTLEIEGFAISRRLGTGGMGAVYEAVNQDGHEVAIKLMPAVFTDDAELAYRFRYEAQLIRKMNHPHIVHGLGSGMAEGQHYLMMELVKGPSLSEVLRRHGPLDERAVLFLIKQIGSALSYAWGRNILHRDIKPANILLGPARLSHRGEPFCAKLCDFGLAKLWAQTEEGRAYWLGRITGQNCAMGTPDYMSPEQATGQDLDHRSDQYNLGATAYHALIGSKFASAASVLEQQRSAHLDLDLLTERGIGADVVALLRGMLNQDPSSRFPDWDAVITRARELIAR